MRGLSALDVVGCGAQPPRVPAQLMPVSAMTLASMYAISQRIGMLHVACQGLLPVSADTKRISG